MRGLAAPRACLMLLIGVSAAVVVLGGSPPKKPVQPGPPWNGGSTPPTATCRRSSQPACLTCPSGRCTACTYNLGQARFVLNQQLGRCECAPGFGIVPVTLGGLCKPSNVPGANPIRAHSSGAGGVVTREAADAADGSSSSSSVAGRTGGRTNRNKAAAAAWHNSSIEAAAAAGPTGEGGQDGSGSGRALLDAVPSWATQCLPCPPDWYSPGGQIGQASCRPCPTAYGTGGVCASPNCLIPKTCGPGKAPNRRTGTCELCPFGTYQPWEGYTGRCIDCPEGYTTQETGSVSEDECWVPICRPGTELSDTFQWCNNCTGINFSPGGVRENGAWQPPCQPCPYPSVPSQDRSRCLEGICPPPDAFTINCSGTIPACGPNANPVFLPTYCTAYPRGARITWYRAQVDNDALPDLSTPVRPPVSFCPAAATGSNVYYPYITSFLKRTDCLCINSADVNCNFVNSTDSNVNDDLVALTTVNGTKVVVPDPQLTSLRKVFAILDPAGGILANGNVTYNILSGGGYCNDDRFTNESLVAITCSSNNIVTGIGLTGFGQYPQGVLPGVAAFSGLPQLRTFRCLACQNLTGSFPQDWGLANTLLNLRTIDISAPTAITGTLPEAWANLVNLEFLRLASSNRTGAFSGGIPSRWGGLSSLNYVNLNRTLLTTGCAPRPWSTVNGLVPNVTLFVPATVGVGTTQPPFCNT